MKSSTTPKILATPAWSSVGMKELTSQSIIRKKKNEESNVDCIAGYPYISS
jgi:hypothetical protein